MSLWGRSYAEQQRAEIWDVDDKDQNVEDDNDPEDPLCESPSKKKGEQYYKSQVYDMIQQPGRY